MTLGRPLFAKLFLEGIEVPFIGASITNTVNQATICYIDLVPHAVINNIKPRTLVHLMVRNINDATGKFPFVLAFQGEVFGYNFGKTTTSRSFSISCIDQSSYWDNVLTYFFNPQQSLGQGAEQMVSEFNNQTIAQKGAAASIKVSHSENAYYKTVINKAFAEAKRKGKTADLFDGLVAIFKDIGGVNDFYSMAEERLRISDRIAAASSGAVEKLLQQQEALDWLMGIASRASGFSSLRMVVNDLMSVLFHDFASISFPGLVANDSVKMSLTKSKVPTTIGEFLFKPNMFMVAPPVCNIFFPDEYSSFNFSRNFFQEPTRLAYKPEIPSFAGAGISGVVLPPVYEPESFAHFMKGPRGAKMPKEFRGPSDTQVDEDKDGGTDPGQFGDKDIVKGKPRESTNGKKREQFFLTNEEKLKGIMLTQESMVPAASQFRQSVSEVGRTSFSKQVAKYMFNKKKFETRQIQITSHLKMSVVPGFTALILDDSSAEQNITAYCSSVTHRIYCNQGGYTNTTLSYARTVKEQDQASGKAGEPLIPPWMSEEIFGKKGKPSATKNKKVSESVAKAGEQVIVPDALSDYFLKLLGEKGSMTINKYTSEPTLQGATDKILEDYREIKKKGGESVASMIDTVTSRRYISMDEAFAFIGATPKGGSSAADFVEYSGPRLFDAKRSDGTTASDVSQLKLRRKVIFDYRDALRASRGFRG